MELDKSLYKDVYVFEEQREGKIQNVAFELLGKARDPANSLNEKVYAILLGNNIKDKANELIAYGADGVVCVDSPELEEYTTEPYAQAIKHIIDVKKPSIILLGATYIGRDLGPRVSARVGTGLTADCTALDISEIKDLMLTRPASGGNVLATIFCSDNRPQMSTVRPGVMEKATLDENRSGKVEKINFKLEEEDINKYYAYE